MRLIPGIVLDCLFRAIPDIITISGAAHWCLLYGDVQLLETCRLLSNSGEVISTGSVRDSTQHNHFVELSWDQGTPSDEMTAQH